MAWMDSAAGSTRAFAARHWGWAALAAWAAAVLGFNLIRLDAYGIDEAAARALLLTWSVGDRVISAIFVLGLPDLRAVLFAPLAAYWPGSIVAAKVYALLLTTCVAALFYRWSREEQGPETALLATGLLLAAPVTVLQADALGGGPFLLLAFALGRWLDRRYRATRRLLGGWYFLQLLWLMISVSIHPAALAYPLALAWEWKRDPLDRRTQRYMIGGIVCALAFVLAMRLGWPGLDWFENPLSSLARAALGEGAGFGSLSWLTGALLGLVLIFIAFAARRRLAGDFMQCALIGGLVIGLACADGAWAMLALAVLLYLGLPHLLRFNQSLEGSGFAGQRGIVMTVVFVALLVFMRADKAHHYAIAQNQLPPVDALILHFTAELEDLGEDRDKPVLTMSQWPGKTMLALRRPALPLPPAYADSDALLAHIKGTDYLLFDQKAERNRELAKNLSEATGTAETVLVEEGGVAVHIRRAAGG